MCRKQNYKSDYTSISMQMHLHKNREKFSLLSEIPLPL